MMCMFESSAYSNPLQTGKSTCCSLVWSVASYILSGIPHLHLHNCKEPYSVQGLLKVRVLCMSHTYGNEEFILNFILPSHVTGAVQVKFILALSFPFTKHDFN